MISRVSVRISCDNCHGEQELRHPTYDPHDVRRRLRILGWKVHINGNHDICPTCAKQLDQKIKGLKREREKLRKTSRLTPSP